MKKDWFTKIRRGILPILLSLIVCGLPCLLLSQWLTFGCLWWECVNSGYLDSQKIQIPHGFFPDEAVYSNLGAVHESEGAKQHQAQQIFWSDNSTALLHVYRYFGTYGAKRRFSTEVRALRELFEIPSEQSRELSYQSASADQYFVGCGERWIQLGYKCVFVARYDEDLISLNITIDEQMTLKDFERIITYLDMVSAKRLGH